MGEKDGKTFFFPIFIFILSYFSDIPPFLKTETRQNILTNRNTLKNTSNTIAS